jgi:phosphate transport system permease protein
MIVLLSVLFAVLALGGLGYYLGRKKTLAMVEEGAVLGTSPGYYAWYVIVVMFGPAVALSVVLAVLQMAGVIAVPIPLLVAGWMALPALLLWPALQTIDESLPARQVCEWVVYGCLATASIISILTTIGILLSVLFDAIKFYRMVGFWNALTGTEWNPGGGFLESVGRGSDTAQSSSYGTLPLFGGTLVITAIAISVAGPIGLLASTYMSEYASTAVRSVAKPVLEILAGIPTVVYGFFAAVTVAPLLVHGVENLLWLLNDGVLPLVGVQGAPLQLDISYQNAFAPGIVMGVMIIPLMSSLCDDVMTSIPDEVRNGAYALGATRSETIKSVIWPASLPGIVSALLLSISRAVGETMIVVMAAGLAATWPPDPLQGTSTVTVHIVYNLTGDLAFDNPQTLSAFGLGLQLLVITLVLNVISSVVIRRFRHQHTGQ